MNKETEFVKAFPFYEKLTEDEKKFAESNIILHKYSKGEVLQACGGNCLGMLYITKGSLRIYMISEEGREITLFRLKKGDYCVLSASCITQHINFETSIVSEAETEELVINSEAFASLTENNIYVKCFMYEILADRFSSVVWTMQQIMFKKIDKRLSEYLISEYEKTQSHELNITHSQIAISINSAREVVERMLKIFASEKLVKLQRGKIILCDIEKLKNF